MRGRNSVSAPSGASDSNVCGLAIYWLIINIVNSGLYVYGSVYLSFNSYCELYISDTEQSQIIRGQWVQDPEIASKCFSMPIPRNYDTVLYMHIVLQAGIIT